jgi:hypothetical protein
VLVWPRTFAPGAVPRVAGDRSFEGSVFRNKAGTTGDLLGVRPYRQGDSPRRIHWRQTARHDRLVVCELQSPAHPLAQVVVDTDPEAHAGDGPQGSREWAIRVAASLIEGWLDQGAQVGAVVDGRTFPAQGGAAQVRLLLDALARIPPRGGSSLCDLREIAEWNRFQGALRVIVTTDRGLLRTPGWLIRDGRTRFVVLCAAAFAPGARRVSEGSSSLAYASGSGAERESSNRLPLPVAPWVWVDDPHHVATQVRRGCKEIPHGL